MTFASFYSPLYFKMTISFFFNSLDLQKYNSYIFKGTLSTPFNLFSYLSSCEIKTCNGPSNKNW